MQRLKNENPVTRRLLVSTCTSLVLKQKMVHDRIHFLIVNYICNISHGQEIIFLIRFYNRLDRHFVNYTLSRSLTLTVLKM